MGTTSKGSSGSAGSSGGEPCRGVLGDAFLDCRPGGREGVRALSGFGLAAALRGFLF